MFELSGHVLTLVKLILQPAVAQTLQRKLTGYMETMNTKLWCLSSRVGGVVSRLEGISETRFDDEMGKRLCETPAAKYEYRLYTVQCSLFASFAASGLP